MGHREWRYPISLAVDHLSRLELGELELEADAAHRSHYDRHQLAEAAGAVNQQRFLSRAQIEGLEQSRQSQPVIGVVVGQKEVRKVGEADGGDQLALRPLPAVDQDSLP